MLPQALSTLPRGARAEVHGLQHGADDAVLLARLAALGFVAGEPVRMLAHGPVGREPLLVQVGHTRFALRRREAERVMVLHCAD
jgi:ferrous iron transport protein A